MVILHAQRSFMKAYHFWYCHPHKRKNCRNILEWWQYENCKDGNGKVCSHRKRKRKYSFSHVVITARVRSTTGRYCFHRCLSVHGGGEGGVRSGTPPPGGTQVWVPPRGVRVPPRGTQTLGGYQSLGTPPGGSGYPPPPRGGTRVRYPPPRGGTEVPPRGGYPGQVPPRGGYQSPGTPPPPPGGYPGQVPPRRGYPGQVRPPPGGGTWPG